MTEVPIYTDKRRRGPTLVSGPQVLQAIVDRFCANPALPTTRADLVKELQVTEPIIKDHVEKLVSSGKVRRLRSGFLVPTQVRPDRAVTVTHIPGFDSKVEIGDVCLDLSQGEIRHLLSLLGGVSRSDMLAEIQAIRDELGLE